ncbi:hypothetical protein B566_EDAN008739 [Ephemera danica]|nr:hypothetical protein B566_EDAN008739 [Ephemera danica]
MVYKFLRLVHPALTDFEGEDEEEEADEVSGPEDGNVLWREEMHKRYQQESQFMAELRARALGNGDYSADKGDYQLQDEDADLFGPDIQAALMRNHRGENGHNEERDDIEGSPSEWEEAMKQWVNR